MNKETTDKINASGKKLNIAVTGGGAGWVGGFLQHTGASKTLHKFTVPYSEQALCEFIKGQPREKFVSDSTARQMAVAAYNECKAVHGPDAAVGIGLTASLFRDITDRKGRFNGGYLAVQTQDKLYVISFKFKESELSRYNQTMVTDFVVGHGVKLATGIITPENLTVGEYAPANTNNCFETYTIESYPDDLSCEDALDYADYLELVNNPLCNMPLGTIDVNAVVFSGSFNPVHQGHLDIARIAEERLGQKPIFELCVYNVEKPQLDFKEVLKRVKDIKSYGYDVVLTNAPKFDDKNSFFQKSVYVVGRDTWDRIEMTPDELKSFGVAQNSFLVFPRNGEKIEMENVHAVQDAMCVLNVHTFQAQLDEIADMKSSDIRKTYT
jgi:nicotinamide mononucleotide (NMN) deamidase PncC